MRYPEDGAYREGWDPAGINVSFTSFRRYRGVESRERAAVLVTNTNVHQAGSRGWRHDQTHTPKCARCESQQPVEGEGEGRVVRGGFGECRP